MIRLFFLIMLAALVSGCAGPSIRQINLGREIPASPPYAKLESYNARGEPVRILGVIEREDWPRVDFAARTAPGEGARFDAVAGAAAKLVFSAACETGAGCEIFIPGKFTLFSGPAGRMGEWLPMLLAGRVSPLGELKAAYSLPDGTVALAFARQGVDWQQVVIDPEKGFPLRAVYGDEGSPPGLEIVFEGRRSDDGLFAPSAIIFNSADEDEKLVLRIDTFERSERPKGGFVLKRPPGVTFSALGRDTWKKLGMFWTPKD